MSSGIKGKLLIGFYVLILLSIPIGAYLVSQNQNPHASAHDTPTNKNPLSGLKPLTSTPSASKTPFLDLGNNDSGSSAEPSASPETTFGPTMNLKVIIQGRPEGKMGTKLFVGIIEGAISSSSPKYVLSFNIDLPDTGAYTGLSLAGLTPGNSYTAILKGPAQVATSSAFTMSPATTNLNGGNPITLLTGDLNEDNVVNSADYSIAKQAFGSNSKSQNWNANVDFNLDGVINSTDLSILMANINTAGQSGMWVSPPPPAPSSSPASGGPEEATSSAAPLSSGQGGYWFWMPKVN